MSELLSNTIKLAISTCPNDTFAFHGLLRGLINTRGLDFQIELLDIQQLNEGLFRGQFDVAKASFHAALKLADRFGVFPSGSALGFGVGPLLLASDPLTSPIDHSLTLCPGAHTTASMLFRLFHGMSSRVEHRVFSEIMPSLLTKAADFGVCIHEGRFTWEQQGLHLVEDLGTRWESETGCPLPLGGILGKHELGAETLGQVQAVIQDSLLLSLKNPESALSSMREHAQEFDDEVLMKHVELYVNDWTVDLGEVGKGALEELSRRALQIGLVESDASQLVIF